MLKTVEAIFNEIGGSGKMANVLGVKPSAASEMRRRASIPVPYWPRLVAHFQGKERSIDNDALVKMHASKKAPKRRQPSRAEAAL